MATPIVADACCTLGWETPLQDSKLWRAVGIMPVPMGFANSENENNVSIDSGISEV